YRMWIIVFTFMVESRPSTVGSHHSRHEFALPIQESDCVSSLKDQRSLYVEDCDFHARACINFPVGDRLSRNAIKPVGDRLSTDDIKPVGDRLSRDAIKPVSDRLSTDAIKPKRRRGARFL
ncbi:hypothetical protein DPMN_012476, partial [Dreissena polymorpha]